MHSYQIKMTLIASMKILNIANAWDNCLDGCLTIRTIDIDL